MKIEVKKEAVASIIDVQVTGAELTLTVSGLKSTRELYKVLGVAMQSAGADKEKSKPTPEPKEEVRESTPEPKEEVKTPVKKARKPRAKKPKVDKSILEDAELTLIDEDVKQVVDLFTGEYAELNPLCSVLSKTNILERDKIVSILDTVGGAKSIREIDSKKTPAVMTALIKEVVSEYALSDDSDATVEDEDEF